MNWEKGNSIPYETITKRFSAYVNNADNIVMEADPLFKETIAVIAFQAYKHSKHPEMGHNLTKLSLAATIESLRRAGFGRTVVSVMVVEDFDIVQDAFKFLLDSVEPDNKHNPEEIVTQAGHMELGYAVIPQETARTKHLNKNMPKATLLGLRNAFLYSQEDDDYKLDDVKKTAVESWLGSRHNTDYFKYVYLTEPDTILQTRPSSLAAIKAEVDTGAVLLPHRLQPIPHESDVRGSNPKFFVSEEFKQVIELDPIGNHDVCCDEQAGPDFKPGRPPYVEKCGGFWYSCGFSRRSSGPEEERHRRLAPYLFMRLKGGTEIAGIAGNEHGRRCVPKKNGVCRPVGM